MTEKVSLMKTIAPNDLLIQISRNFFPRPETMKAKVRFVLMIIELEIPYTSRNIIFGSHSTVLYLDDKCICYLYLISVHRKTYNKKHDAHTQCLSKSFK